jgi:hypothetical protein
MASLIIDWATILSIPHPDLITNSHFFIEVIEKTVAISRSESLEAIHYKGLIQLYNLGTVYSQHVISALVKIYFHSSCFRTQYFCVLAMEEVQHHDLFYSVKHLLTAEILSILQCQIAYTGNSLRCLHLLVPKFLPVSLPT